MESLQSLLHRHHFPFQNKDGISIAQVSDQETGLILANKVLLSCVTRETVLFLSGGRTPWALYETIAKEKKLSPGAVGMIDERFGVKWHDNSNEKKLRETGLLDYYHNTGTPVFLVLQENIPREKTAIAYDRTVRMVHERYRTLIGILGIGLDGHTAGLPALSEKFKIQNSKLYKDKSSLVTEYNDDGGFYGERVTMTFAGLVMLDLSIILVFGADKKDALEKAFSKGSEEEIPARFFRRPGIAEKTLLITDQKV